MALVGTKARIVERIYAFVVADFLCLEKSLKSRINNFTFSVERVGKGSDAIGRSVRCLQGRC